MRVFIFVVEKEINTNKTSLDAIYKFPLIDSTTIGFGIKLIDRAALRPTGVLVGMIVRDIRCGRSFVTYR